MSLVTNAPPISMVSMVSKSCQAVLTTYSAASCEVVVPSNVLHWRGGACADDIFLLFRKPTWRCIASLPLVWSSLPVYVTELTTPRTALTMDSLWHSWRLRKPTLFVFSKVTESIVD